MSVEQALRTLVELKDIQENEHDRYESVEGKLAKRDAWADARAALENTEPSPTEEALCQSRDEWKALAIAKHARVKELERALKHIQKEAYNGNTDRCWATARAALSGKQ